MNSYLLAPCPICFRKRREKAAAARRDSRKPRRIDPTTCERDYTPAEFEFMTAMQRYKERTGRLFPTWSEALGVLIELGYAKPKTAS